MIPHGYVYPGVTRLLLRVSRARRHVALAKRQTGPGSAHALTVARTLFAAELDILRVYNGVFEVATGVHHA